MTHRTVGQMIGLAFAAHKANRAMGFRPSVENSDASELAEYALESAITELVAERDRWKQHHKELVNDFLPDGLDCLPSCDSYGHSDDCPAVDAQAAARQLKKERDEAVEALGITESAVTRMENRLVMTRSERDNLEAANRELREAVEHMKRIILQCGNCFMDHMDDLEKVDALLERVRGGT